MKREMIVFEGIDNSGKTTISKMFQEYLTNKDGADALNEKLYENADYSHMYIPWEWTKEPEFSTEEADRLNSGDIDEFKREALFLESRNNRQEFYNSNSCVVDRYLWTGMAYAKKFSPNCFEFAKAIYTGPMFKKPDLYVFVNTPVEECDKRDPTVGIDRLNDIKQAYLDTKDLIEQPIIEISSVGSVEEVLKELIEKYEKHIEGK